MRVFTLILFAFAKSETDKIYDDGEVNSINRFNIYVKVNDGHEADQIAVDLKLSDAASIGNFPDEDLSLSRNKRYITPKIPNTYWDEMVKIHQQTNLKMMCSITPCQRLPLLVKNEVGSDKFLDSEDQSLFSASEVCSMA